MKELLTLLAATVALISLLPSASEAACIATGTVPRVNISGSSDSSVGVRDNGASTTFFNFTTSNAKLINAALVAEASHITVQVVGNAASCGPVIGGVSAGGAIVSILVSP